MELYSFFDANGIEWAWDKDNQTVYAKDSGADDEDNGYYSETLEDAIRQLEEYGYMEK